MGFAERILVHATLISTLACLTGTDLCPDFQNTQLRKQAVVAQLVERVLGKDEVTGSIPVNGSRFFCSGEDAHGEREI